MVDSIMLKYFFFMVVVVWLCVELLSELIGEILDILDILDELAVTDVSGNSFSARLAPLLCK